MADSKADKTHGYDTHWNMSESDSHTMEVYYPWYSRESCKKATISNKVLKLLSNKSAQYLYLLYHTDNAIFIVESDEPRAHEPLIYINGNISYEVFVKALHENNLSCEYWCPDMEIMNALKHSLEFDSSELRSFAKKVENLKEDEDFSSAILYINDGILDYSEI
jgi:hypothetical protein